MTPGMQSFRNQNGGPTSPAPLIKNEPRDDQGFSYMTTGGFSTNFHGGNGINPSELHGTSFHNGGWGGQQGGPGMFNDDELAEGLMDTQMNNGFEHAQHDQFGGVSMLDNYNDSIDLTQPYNAQPQQEPVQSPYLQTFPQSLRQMRNFNGEGTPSSFGSPHLGAGSPFEYMDKSVKRPISNMQRTTSQHSPIPMSPHTPTTPHLGASSVPVQVMQRPRHIKTMSAQYDNASLNFGLESPMSPHNLDAFKKQAGSLPAKTDAFQTQEMKRRRRRESHNLVERRRRDNINERIQELSGLVPTHRLEDEKVKKQLQTNGQLSPQIGQSGSPPRATSMLAGGIGRRASGVPNSLVPDEKDKGPNKGDILNGAVGWMKDLMWALHRKTEQEKQLRALVLQLGGTLPAYEETEEDRRMESELRRALGKHEAGADGFSYSRGPGAGLRVPGFTDYAGNPVKEGEEMSPGARESAGASSGGTPAGGQGFWGEGMQLKEEDEFAVGMDMS
ncbi:hypothetical protein EX30DRAFT_199094 [Ascodesmis nigricans]|uniref:BHLH domain-containing protein n=1 Tax=Ascodesmis nigricans TaxID=341454 RepID=A0A4S2MKR3_9PEZI|nr:hypothetical protein EX30DRAFT_199094 [Ascodesmis nigricans]